MTHLIVSAAQIDFQCSVFTWKMMIEPILRAFAILFICQLFIYLFCAQISSKEKKKRILTHTLLRKTVQFSHSQIAVSSAKPWQTMRMTRVILRERFVSNIPFPLRNISIQSFRRCRRR